MLGLTAFLFKCLLLLLNPCCVLQTYLAVGKDVVMVGLGDTKFQIQLLQWSLGIMKTGTVASFTY